MPQITIERSMKIHAPPLKVWRAFTDPVYTKDAFGGEIVTDWSVGSKYDWMGKDGEVHSHGIILSVEPQKFLQYELFRPEKGRKDAQSSVFSVITYELHEEGEYTTLAIKEEFTSFLTQEEFTLAGAAWFEALGTIKRLSET